jgi:hypothetical protein
VTEEAALWTGVRMVVIGDISHVVVDVVRELEMRLHHVREPIVHVLQVLRRRVTPWCRHTTMGVAQISHSAIQQMSSS